MSRSLVHLLADALRSPQNATVEKLNRLLKDNYSIFKPENWKDIKTTGLVVTILGLPMTDGRGRMSVRCFLECPDENARSKRLRH